MLYFEEPLYENVTRPVLRATDTDGIRVLTPILPEGTTPSQATAMLRALLNNALASVSYDRLVLWYYTPMALPFSRSRRATTSASMTAWTSFPPSRTRRANSCRWSGC